MLKEEKPRAVYTFLWRIFLLSLLLHAIVLYYVAAQVVFVEYEAFDEPIFSIRLVADKLELEAGSSTDKTNEAIEQQEQKDGISDESEAASQSTKMLEKPMQEVKPIIPVLDLEKKSSFESDSSALTPLSYSQIYKSAVKEFVINADPEPSLGDAVIFDPRLRQKFNKKQLVRQKNEFGGKEIESFITIHGDEITVNDGKCFQTATSGAGQFYYLVKCGVVKTEQEKMSEAFRRALRDRGYR